MESQIPAEHSPVPGDAAVGGQRTLIRGSGIEVSKLPASVVCVAAMTDEIGRLNAQMAIQSGSKRGAILYFADDAFMSTVAKSTEAALRASGNPIVLSESYSARQGDFRTLLLKAKANGADSLYIYGYDEAANIMKQAR